MHRSICALTLVLGLAWTATGQTTETPPAATGSEKPAADKPADATPAAPPASAWSVGPIDFSGLVDGYYSANFNHPASQTNQLYNFNVKANQFSLNMAKLTMAHTADPIGFQIDLGFGRAFDMIHATEKAPNVFQYIEQAFITVKPASLKGMQLDFGQFVTNAGAEVIETHSNWNYSRSILFSWAIPYYHFGARATMPFNSHFSGVFGVYNGWNNVEDNNSGKTIHVGANFTGKKVSWSNNYMVGPEKADTNKGLRHLYDTTLLLTPNDHANFYINYDYGVDKHIGSGEDVWNGIAFAGRFSKGDWAFAPRYEWFNDHNGFSTGTAQTLKEFTLTGEYKMKEGLISRLEFRRDMSDQPFFDRGADIASVKTQSTLTLGIVAYFGPKR